MIKNYLKIATRTLLRRKGYTLINIAGLAVGTAVCLLIALFIRHELSYDRFHENADRIYRPVMSYGGIGGSALIPAEAAPRIAELPEVDRFVRVHPVSEVVLYENDSIREDHFHYADASFFDVFSFLLVRGNPRTALAAPNTVVLTESTSRRYFGERDPIGETLTLQNGTTLSVTGIAADAPSNSHLQFGLIASLRTLGYSDETGDESGWGPQSWTYLLLSSRAAAPNLQRKLDDITDREFSEITARLGFAVEGMAFDLQPLEDIHLQPALSGIIQPEGDVRYLYIFGAIAFFILLIAAINYMNLATARSMQRAQEVGVRRVMGARRTQLAAQFLSEAVLVSFLAYGVALLIVRLLLTASESLFGPALDLRSVYDPSFAGLLAGAALLTGIVSGSYPALILSRFAAASVLKYGAGGSGSAGRLRKGLVTFQFTVSIALIIGTLVVQAQLNYMQTKPLGYDAERVLMLPIPGADPERSSTGAYAAERDEAFKGEFLRTPGVQRVSVATGLPMRSFTFSMDHEDEGIPVAFLSVDYDYFEATGMHLVSGRNFSKEIARDAGESIILNETAARLFRLEDKVGQEIDLNMPFEEPRLIGIVSDFHTGSLHHPIVPTVLSVQPAFYNAFVLRVDGRQLPQLLPSLKDTWQRLAPEYPFEVRFADEVLRAQYDAERRLARTFRYFAALAVFISCLGLFGLAAYTADQRTKEVGIRKVMGATVSGVVALLTKDFARLVLIAFVLAVPLAYVAMNRWLEDFAYRIELGPAAFLAAGALAFVVALLTSGYHAVRAALADPVKSLRYE